jgi:hypothetical protein
MYGRLRPMYRRYQDRSDTREGQEPPELRAQRQADSRARIDTVETASVVGENSLVTITFTNCRIRRYSMDDEKEDWTVEFESAKRHTLSIGAAR